MRFEIESFPYFGKFGWFNLYSDNITGNFCTTPGSY